MIHQANTHFWHRVHIEKLSVVKMKNVNTEYIGTQALGNQQRAHMSEPTGMSVIIWASARATLAFVVVESSGAVHS